MPSEFISKNGVITTQLQLILSAEIQSYAELCRRIHQRFVFIEVKAVGKSVLVKVNRGKIFKKVLFRNIIHI